VSQRKWPIKGLPGTYSLQAETGWYREASSSRPCKGRELFLLYVHLEGGGFMESDLGDLVIGKSQALQIEAADSLAITTKHLTD
jgi:hypothetical protein